MTKNLSLIIAAFVEVRQFCPQASIVSYDEDGRWCYQSNQCEPVTFPAGINVSLLEDAAYSVAECPAAFIFHPDTGTATEVYFQ